MSTSKHLPEGFQEIWRVEVGSTVHGCSVQDQDDQDLMGVCIEPPDHVLGLKGFEQHQYRDAWLRSFQCPLCLDHPVKLCKCCQGTGRATPGASTQPQPRSLPGDLDLVVYSLRKWCRLALTGNPSALLLLYSPKVIIDTPLGRELKRLAPVFRSKRVAYAYLGYMREQRERLEGKRGQKNVVRADLIAKYGYDTKYAYHILRLGIQGNEYCTTGDISVPLKPVHREFLLKVRTGQVSLLEAMQHAETFEAQLRSRLMEPGATVLPDSPDEDAVTKFLIHAYQTAWQTSVPPPVEGRSIHWDTWGTQKGLF